MKEKLTNNLGLKVLSVLLAFLIWLAVVNISNPEVTGTQQVPLEVLNANVLESKNKTFEIVGGRDTVSVSYKVQMLDRSSIKASDFKAYIDLADLYEPTGSVPVNVEVLNHDNLIFSGSVTANPGSVRIQTEDLQTKSFDLRVNTIGETEEGYQPGTAVLDQTYVYVSGPVSKVGQISEVGIEIDVEGANGNLTGTAKPKFYDANGNELEDLESDGAVSVDHTEIQYELQILKVKDVALNFETEGRVADGYRFTGVESSVNSVKLVGLKSKLAELSVITVPKSELNMDGATGDKEVTVDLSKYVPEGVQIAGGSSQITVVIKVEPLETRTYALSTSRIKQVGASSQYSYQYDRDTINVVIRGLKEDLDQLVPDAIEAELDVSGMGAGSYEGSIEFQLSDAYELVGYDKPQVTVQERTEAAPAEETSEPAEETEASEGETQTEAEAEA